MSAKEHTTCPTMCIMSTEKVMGGNSLTIAFSEFGLCHQQMLLNKQELTGNWSHTSPYSAPIIFVQST